eukprot:scaffold114890_cov63-Phaeocystis_antarctica.AAC.3
MASKLNLDSDAPPRPLPRHKSAIEDLAICSSGWVVREWRVKFHAELLGEVERRLPKFESGRLRHRGALGPRALRT